MIIKSFNKEQSMDFIILAAGVSSRFQEANKLLLPYNGMPLCLHCVSQVIDAMDTNEDELVIVTGFESDKIRSVLSASPRVSEGLRSGSIRFTLNPRYEKGQFSSTKAGASALSGDSPFFITLCDLPLLTSKCFLALVPFLANHDAVRPFSNGRPGHPVLLSGRMRSAILSSGDDLSVRKLLEGRDICNLEVEGPEWTTDIDTASDYSDLTDRQKRTRNNEIMLL